MSPTALNILHLTDLHAGQPEHNDFYVHMLEGLRKDLEKTHKKSGPWDLVIFSGDLAFSGQKKEFDIIESFREDLNKTLTSLGSGNAVLLAVPGNHDLKRPSAVEPAALSLTVLSHLPAGKRKLIWTDIVENPNSDYRKLLDRVFEEYVQWWQLRADEAKGRLALFQPGLLPGDFAACFAKGDCRFGIVGLNTTFLQLEGGNFLNRLETHVQQYNRLLPPGDQFWLQDVDAAVLVTHQPPDWLSEANRQECFEPLIAKSGRFAAHLCGHKHVAELKSVGGGAFPERRLFQGPSLLGLEPTEDGTERLLGYQALRITIDKKAEFGNVRCWPRKVWTKTQNNDWNFEIDTTYKLEEDQGTPEAHFQRPNWQKKKSLGQAPEPQFLVKTLEGSADDVTVTTRAEEIGRQAALRDEDVFFEGPEGSGKTIALTALLSQATQLGKKVVFITLMEFDEELNQYGLFWQSLGAQMYNQLKGVADLEAPAQDLNFQTLTLYLFEQVLSKAYPLVIGFDEVGRLRQRPTEAAFYRILRVWRDKDRYYFGDQSRLRLALAGIERLRELPDKGDKGSRVVRLRDIPIDKLPSSDLKPG